MGEAPPRIYLICDDHSIESGRTTSGNQTASPRTPCPSCLYSPQKWAAEGCPWWSEMCLTAKPSSRRAWVVSAMLVPPAELSPEMEAALGKESRPEPLLVAVRQEKLLEKLNLDGLAHWSPENAVAVRELVLAYHDVFMLESNKLSCTSATEYEICIENDEPFKERFWHIPPPLLEEVCASLRDMLEAGVIHPSQSPWCNMVILVRKKDSTLHFCMDFRHVNACMKKDSYPLPQIQEVLESMAGSAHFLSMDFKSGFWQIKMALELQQYMAFMVGNLGFYKFTRMPFGLCNTLAKFQCLMQNTLEELNLMYCVIY